jgi:hypothetical protein
MQADDGVNEQQSCVAVGPVHDQQTDQHGVREIRRKPDNHGFSRTAPETVTGHGDAKREGDEGSRIERQQESWIERGAKIDIQHRPEQQAGRCEVVDEAHQAGNAGNREQLEPDAEETHRDQEENGSDNVDDQHRSSRLPAKSLRTVSRRRTLQRVTAEASSVHEAPARVQHKSYHNPVAQRAIQVLFPTTSVLPARRRTQVLVAPDGAKGNGPILPPPSTLPHHPGSLR